MSKYKEYKQLDLPAVGKEILDWWKQNDIFHKSVDQREGKEPFVFYEGPPSANGMPGIHHVMARTIKDIFCRYKTQQGFQVQRKAGWDTHGLPVELAVEKELDITKDDIGEKISVEEYNQKCREAVMRYTSEWESVTEQMGYWVDMEDPYVTYDSKYIESVWWLLKNLFDKDLLYKGYSVQPYSPAAGTGLSTHELNLPGCYRPVKDTSVVAQFKVERNDMSDFLFDSDEEDVRFLAWTTTPWTLLSNCALAVGKRINYIKIRTFNPYTYKPVSVILAKELKDKFFVNLEFREESPVCSVDEMEALKKWLDNGKSFTESTIENLLHNSVANQLPYQTIAEFSGEQLEGVRYNQLMPYAQPDESEGEAFRVIIGDFVSTEDGTGIVHTASIFGADDFRVCQQNNVPSILVKDEIGDMVPLVTKQGRFRPEVTDWPNRPLKEEYETEPVPDDYKPTDVLIAIKLKEENKAFKVEKYEHNYPHCWRTDKPILYYPLDSWFVKASATKERMSELNDSINWKPASTGTGRFGEWLSNLQDWNLSRSRYWGVPLPVWSTIDGKQEKCIGSIEELKKEIDKSVEHGFMDENPLKGFQPNDFSKENYASVDLHRPMVDDVQLCTDDGKEVMLWEGDLIDVWFDSGAMPYAQVHYPFENKELIDEGKAFPADYIAEGVDQTRGWFYTLHAIATMCFDSLAYKNVISNGLVLDKEGQKMSKRLGNAVDPFETIEKYGPDATRWYMITNAQPWDNLKFDSDGIVETQRKFFRALHNTYAFFALYANVDGFSYQEDDIDIKERPEIDRWIISKLNSLIKIVGDYYEDYEPTRAGRAIQNFVVDDLSNWYVRLCRKRFWRGDYEKDKIAAYQTLYYCLETVAKLTAPIAPFYADRLFTDINSVSKKDPSESVHLSRFPSTNDELIDIDLEEKMGIAQNMSSLVLSIRKKEQIRVRQPLQKIMVPVLNEKFRAQVENVRNLILNEVNVKELEYIEENSGVLVKKIKPNFKTLGPKHGKLMKQIAAKVADFSQEDISQIEKEGGYQMDVDGEILDLVTEDFEIASEDIPGLIVASEDRITVALDITISDELKEEGIARELVNRIQNLRKDTGLEVTDRITLTVKKHDKIVDAINNNLPYICSETLADEFAWSNELKPEGGTAVEVADGVETTVIIKKLN